MAKLVEMGVKRKAMYPSETAPAQPKSEADYDNEMVHPELSMRGAHARIMNADELKVGERFQQVCEWEVCRIEKRQTDNKEPEYELTLKLVGVGDQESCGKGEEEDDDEDEDESESEDIGPAMAFIHSRAAEG